MIEKAKREMEGDERMKGILRKREMQIAIDYKNDRKEN